MCQLVLNMVAQLLGALEPVLPRLTLLALNVSKSRVSRSTLAASGVRGEEGGVLGSLYCHLLLVIPTVLPPRPRPRSLRLERRRALGRGSLPRLRRRFAQQAGENGGALVQHVVVFLAGRGWFGYFRDGIGGMSRAGLSIVVVLVVWE
jgi:hypothetical protein